MEDNKDIEFEVLPEDYSVREFYERYRDKLPQLVMVTQGYMGEGIFETFDSGQVFRIETYSTQRRVVAEVVSGDKGMYGLQGRQISIPADYDVKFHVLRVGRFKVGKPSSLREIITHKDLPVDVQFDETEEKTVKIGQSERQTFTSFTLKLLHTYDDFYLLGNAISDGHLYGSVTAVPAYLPDLKFAPVKSIKGYTEEQYQGFLKTTEQCVEKITFDKNFGNTEIALYSADHATAEESYSYISPCEYYNIGELLKQPVPKPSKKAPKSQNKNEVLYELVQFSSQSPSATSNPTYGNASDTISATTHANPEGNTLTKPHRPVVPKKPSIEREKSTDDTEGDVKASPPPLTQRKSIADARFYHKIAATSETNDLAESVHVTGSQEFQKMASRDKAENEIDVEFETQPGEYSARSFYEHYKDSLPQMVKVTQGYMGEVGFETFDMGQVFRIQTYSSQRRVVAVVVSGEKGMYGLQGRQISIPVDYDVKFNVMKHGKPKGKLLTLQELISQKDLPLDVQCAGHAEETKFGPLERTSLFTLRLLNVYDDFYLLGNAICYGNLYQSVTAIPAYLPDLKFSIIKSIKGHNEDEYHHFLTVADQFVKEHITFDPTFGNTDIALYSSEQAHGTESYSYISPCEYYNIGDLLRHNKPKPASRPGRKDTDKVYEVFRASTISLGKDNMYSNLDNSERKRMTPVVDKKVLEESISTLRKSTAVGKVDGTDIKDSPKTSYENITPCGNGRFSHMDSEKKPLRPPSNVTKPRSEQEPKSTVNNPQSPPVLRKHADQPPIAESQEEVPDIPPSIPKRHSVTEIPKASPHSSLVGRATPVRPQQHTTREETVQRVVSSGPENVGSLSMEDICDWLDKLNLSQYRQTFYDNMVDGVILLSMDEQMLREEFNMSRFEAMKLMKFAKSGHIPKRRE